MSQHLGEEDCSYAINSCFDGTDFDYERIRSFSSQMEIMNELQISIQQTDLRKIAKNQLLDDENVMKSR